MFTVLSTLVAVLAFLWLLVGVWACANGRDDYSHLSHTISELGETGRSGSERVAVGVFLPVAVLLFAVAAMIWRTDQRVATLAICVGIGYVTAVIAPCDPNSPIFGSAQQGFHNLGGAVEYLGGALSLWAIAENRGVIFFTLGWLVALGAVAVTTPSPWRGLIQRAVETVLFGGVIYGCMSTIA